MFRRTLFHDRRDAGTQLAFALRRYAAAPTLVLGLARGGVPVAAELAARLGADFDAAVVRKLGAPGSPELAIGAVTASGGRYLNDDVIRELHVREDYIESVAAAESAEARRQEQRLRGGRALPSAEDRTVILVDDGLATGATMLAAARAIRHQGPRALVVAVPVGAREGCRALALDADAVVCLYQPEPFWAVGLYYQDFRPVEDADVRALLERAHSASAAR